MGSYHRPPPDLLNPVEYCVVTDLNFAWSMYNDQCKLNFWDYFSIVNRHRNTRSAINERLQVPIVKTPKYNGAYRIRTAKALNSLPPFSLSLPKQRFHAEAVQYAKNFYMSLVLQGKFGPLREHQLEEAQSHQARSTLRRPHFNA